MYAACRHLGGISSVCAYTGQSARYHTNSKNNISLKPKLGPDPRSLNWGRPQSWRLLFELLDHDHDHNHDDIPPRVFVMTPGTAHNALMTGMLPVERVAMIIFDEAHHW
jgi:hypothetical protein